MSIPNLLDRLVRKYFESPRCGGTRLTDRARWSPLRFEVLEDRSTPAGITGLFNTGVDASGVPLTSGTDTHYTVVFNGQGNSAFNGPAVFQSAHSGVSANIQPPGSAGNALTSFDYRTTFTLAPGYDPNTVTISGTTSADDQVNNILVNGVSTGDTTGAFALSSGFVAGTNTLDFVTQNTTAGTTNLDVEFTTATALLLAPTLTSISPASATVGAGNTAITVTGTNFASGSTVNFKGVPLGTTFVSTTQLTAIIPAPDLVMSGAASVTVVTPGPGGGTSNAVTFMVGTSYLSPFTGDRSAAFAGLSAQQHFVQALYLDALGRPGIVAELNGYLPTLNAPNGQMVVAQAVEDSPEGRDNLVKGWYETYLGRAAGNGEELGWVRQLLNGASEERVLSQILGSQEFFQRAQTLVSSGTPQERFVQALYLLVLNRTPAQSEIEGHVAELNSGASPARVALNFLDSPEFRTDLVVEYYGTLLHRTATASEISGWVGSRLDAFEIRIGFESSPEYFANG
jgi:hypothetical protein